MTDLRLGGNNILDLSPLAGLTNLKMLRLEDNRISDLSPLVANAGLEDGDEVYLRGNPLSYLSIHTHIRTLQSRGVTVEFDDTAHLNVGTPRTVRLIYFLPNDRPYRADVVQRMKDEILKVQIFFAEQMGLHGYGTKTFRIETDSQGEPMVHRVDGQYPDNHYFNRDLPKYLDPVESKVVDEIASTFNIRANIYVIFIDTDIGKGWGGAGQRLGNGGEVLVSPPFEESILRLVAHELGHAFGLLHDFRDGSFLMSYGSVGPASRDQLSECHADFLSVHPYFHPDTPIEDLSAPAIKLISPRPYPADAKSIPIRLQASDSEGLHQAILYTAPYNGPTILTNDSTVKACFGLDGKKETVIDFDYDGIVPFVHNPSYSSSNSFVHPIHVDVVDTSGNMTQIDFLLFSEALQPLSKILGDNQTGLPNKPLPTPFVIEVWDVNSGYPRIGIFITFTVITGAGTLSVTRTKTDEKGRAESILTLGPNLGTTTVEVSAAGIEGTVTFTAVAGAAVGIPDQHLRAAVETALGKAEDDPIASSEMTTLTRLGAANSNISDLTGLEFATNLQSLALGYGEVGNSNAVKDLSPLANLIQLTSLDLAGNSISDISAVTGLTNLTWLHFWGNSISDVSPVVGLTNLTDLYLGDNNISDLSPLVTNTGLGSGDKVNVQYNPLSYLSIYTHIPTLQSRGVTVESDNRPHPALLKVSGDNQKGAAFASLSQPFIVEAQDENGSAITGISVTFTVTAGGGTLSTTITRTDTNGRAQSTLTLGSNLGTNTVEVSATKIEVPVTFHAIADTKLPPIAADVNGDGSVNVLDLIVIASSFGQSGQNNADVNRDGVVSILDLVLAAGMFEGAAAAPAAQPQVSETLTAVEVQNWLADARKLEVRDPIMKQGIIILEQLLLSLTPKETELLANYPNPFNPETWIPYRLAEDVFVTLTIYDLNGHVVRTLDVGHRIASAYESRSKAIHWDGRNNVGEQVASGVYFYTLTAADYSATRQMVILK